MLRVRTIPRPGESTIRRVAALSYFEYDKGMATSKVSLSLSAELVTAARRRVGPRGLSLYVNEALRYQLQRDRLVGLLEEFDHELGPVEGRVMEEVRQSWPKPGSKGRRHMTG